MADTGWKSPTATGTPNNTWTNPTYAYSSDGNFATKATDAENDANTRQAYSSFGFGVPAGATINGIEASLEWYMTDATAIGKFYVKIYDQAGLRLKLVPRRTSEGTDVVGGATDVWSGTWTSTNLGDAQFYALVSCYTDDGSDTITVSLDHIQIKVYYTEGASSAIKTINGLAKASNKTVNGLAIASVKTWNGLA